MPLEALNRKGQVRPTNRQYSKRLGIVFSEPAFSDKQRILNEAISLQIGELRLTSCTLSRARRRCVSKSASISGFQSACLNQSPRRIVFGLTSSKPTGIPEHHAAAQQSGYVSQRGYRKTDRVRQRRTMRIMLSV